MTIQKHTAYPKITDTAKHAIYSGRKSPIYVGILGETIQGFLSFKLAFFTL